MYYGANHAKMLSTPRRMISWYLSLTVVSDVDFKYLMPIYTYITLHLLMVFFYITVESLLRESTIQVNVVSGQFDLTAATPGSLDWVDALKWPNKVDGMMINIVLNGRFHGYFRTQHQLTFYSVWKAGHAVPLQNPEAMNFILQHIIHKSLTA